MNELPCGCCEGVDPSTPRPVANPPGLPVLAYRAGTHGSFLATMVARLASREFPALRDLTTRDRGDPAVALLDAWAAAADVLTFYQERLANEAYLRTATQRRSMLELANLVGYQLRPGVAASVHVAYTFDDGQDGVVPAGSRVQSVPGPGELPQTFETSELLHGRSSFNRLVPRLTRPQQVGAATGRLWFAGTATGLAPGDGLLVDLGDGQDPMFRLVDAVQVDHERGRTGVTLQGLAPIEAPPVKVTLQELVESLLSSMKAELDEIGRELVQPFPASSGAEVLDRLGRFQPSIAGILPQAVANATMTDQPKLRIYAFRVKASVFGHNAPLRLVSVTGGVPNLVEWTLLDAEEDMTEDETVVFLDARYDKVGPGGWIVFDYSGVDPKQRYLPVKLSDHRLFTTVDAAAAVSRAQYGISGPTTRVELQDGWLDFGNESDGDTIDDFSIVRRTVVYAQSEELPLAQMPIEECVWGQVIELDHLYEGLEAGRLVVVAGERCDLPVAGVPAAEVVRIAAVAHATAAVPNDEHPGDAVHTFLLLAGDGLVHSYVRDTLVIYGNVVHATHGETHTEILGSGNGAAPAQQFSLRQPPLTFVSAPTPSGIASSLEVRVNDVRWPEVPSLALLGGNERGYMSRASDDLVTAVTFGDGRHGRRLPSGIENVRARYRAGIGRGGNLDAGRLTLLASKPLGVKEVVNPVPATGGADADRIDDARRNVPVSLTALGRLVSLQDYADFARTFAGIAKASAVWLVNGGHRLVHVTVAGVGDIPIAPSSDLLTNLRLALRRFGSPEVALSVLPRMLLLADLSARVRMDPDADWTVVEAAIRRSLIAALGFDQRELGQDLTESEVLAAIHGVAGVTSAWLDEFQALAYHDGQVVTIAPYTVPTSDPKLRLPYHPGRRLLAAEATVSGDEVQPAQVLHLGQDSPDTLRLALEPA